MLSMKSPPRLHALRLSLEHLALRHLERERLSAPPMQAFLAVPVPERLILLAKLDGADDKHIKWLLRASDADVALFSDRMVSAVAALTAAMDEPWGFIDPQVDPELQLMQGLFRHVPIALIGEVVPPELSTLTIDQRLAMYLVLVCGLSYKITSPEVERLLGCSEFFVRTAIIQAQHLISSPPQEGITKEVYETSVNRRRQ